MPRRPSKKARLQGKPRAVNRADGKIKKWDKITDIPLDEEDQFHANRDKILLEGDGPEGDDGDDDEVFALKGLEDDDDEDEDADAMDEDDADELPAEKPKKKAKKGKKSKPPPSDDEEEEEEEEEETWGRGRGAYYASNDAQLDSDDEEANALEEAEAQRLQKKGRDALAAQDFGLDDAADVALPADEADPLEETVAPAAPALPQDRESVLRHLEKTSPETLALARDWDDVAWTLTKTKEKISKIEADEPDALSLGMVHLHYQALLSYATALAFYLYLRASAKYAAHPDRLQAHPVFARLLTLKQALSTLEELDFAASDSEDDSDDSDADAEEAESEAESMDDDTRMLDAEALWALDRDGAGLDADELADLLADSAKDATPAGPTTTTDKPPKKKRKTAPAPVFDLVEPVFAHTKPKATRRPGADAGADAYGEAAALPHADAADKSARRKTLRFHTSKIESARARRAGARSGAVGGDDDIPYRERRRERDARLAKEAASKVRGQGGADLDDAEPEAVVGGKRPREDDDEDGGSGEEGEDGYYELVQRKSREKKEKKKAEYEALQAAARPDIDEEGSSGPRSLTRAILANKGLTPHRPKSVRNPRVKKRQKFEKAKKKIASQKAVYKGGIGNTGRYDGEKTGVSKVVKGIRLG